MYENDEVSNLNFSTTNFCSSLRHNADEFKFRCLYPENYLIKEIVDVNPVSTDDNEEVNLVT